MSLQIEGLPAVEAELTYIPRGGERPRSYATEPPAGVPWRNTPDEARRVPIHDLRSAASAPTLDVEGFAVVRHRSALTGFADEAVVRAVYYPEGERLLREATGADRVLIFDHTIRRHMPGVEDRRGGGPRQPARRIHVDQTVDSGPKRVRDLLPDEAEALLQGRVQIINLWRPIRGPVVDAPLALCDAASVAPGELVATDLVYQQRLGEIYSLTYSPAHRWFYLSGMQTDEALLLKCYDSAEDGRARFTPHSAFTDPTAPADAPPRESIELRALVFHRA